MSSTAATLGVGARLALVAAAVSCLAGCPNVERDLEDYEERQAEAPPIVITTDCGEAATEIEGQFVFALSSDLGPTTPLMFLTEITTEADGLSFTFQPLAAADRKTPVGDAVTVSGFPIVDGKIAADLPVLKVPGSGNPISGTDIEADIALDGAVCADAICGKVTGEVIKPLEYVLKKSSFYMERVDGGPLPVEPYLDCSKEKKADPLAPQ